MKEAVQLKENVSVAASGKLEHRSAKGKQSMKILKNKTRQPLICKTNTQDNASLTTSKQDGKQRKSRNKLGLRFSVCEDKPATVEVSVGSSVDAATQTDEARAAAHDGGATTAGGDGGATAAGDDGGATAAAAAVQRSAAPATSSVEQDLCSGEPSADYWRALAAARERALAATLAENQKLQEQVRLLEQEVGLLQEVVQRAEDVIQGVQDWTEEQQPQ